MSLVVGLFVCFVVSMVAARKFTTELLTLERCPVINGKEIDYTFQLKNDEQGRKYFTFEGKLDTEINEEFTYQADVEIHNGFHYVDYMQGDGKLCESIIKIAEKAFAKFEGALEPPITKSCKIPPGHYKILKFTIDEGEFESLVPTNGQFRAKIHFLHAGGTEIMCLIVEVNQKFDDDDDDESEE